MEFSPHNAAVCVGGEGGRRRRRGEERRGEERRGEERRGEERGWEGMAGNGRGAEEGEEKEHLVQKPRGRIRGVY